MIDYGPQERPLVLAIEQALHAPPISVWDLLQQQGPMWLTSTDFCYEWPSGLSMMMSSANFLALRNLGSRFDIDDGGQEFLRRIDDMRRAMFIDTGRYPNYIRIAEDRFELFKRTAIYKEMLDHQGQVDNIFRFHGIPFVTIGDLADKTFVLLGRNAITIE